MESGGSFGKHTSNPSSYGRHAGHGSSIRVDKTSSLSSSNSNGGGVKKKKTLIGSSRLTSAMFASRNNLLSQTKSEKSKSQSTSLSATERAKQLAENATLSSQEKWRLKQDKEPGARISKLIGGSTSEDEMEGEDSDTERSQSQRDGITNLLGLKRQILDKHTRQQQIIDDMLNEDSYYGVSRQPSADSKDNLVSLDVAKILEDDDFGGDEKSFLEDDDSFLDTTIKDAKYYDTQRRHTLERGRSLGYPDTLDEQELKKRAIKLVPAMRDIIKGCTMSVYHDAAQMALQSYFIRHTNSKDPSVHYKRFGGGSGTRRLDDPKTMPASKAAQLEGLSAETGYYGPRGQETIATCLIDHLESDFFKNTSDADNNRLGIHTDNFQYNDQWWMQYLGLNNYIVLVIVPEALSRLVADDKGIPINEARTIVKESTSYGMIKFPNLVVQDELSSGISDDSGDESFFK